MASKKLSIIIPTFNKLDRLRLVLKSLENQITDDIEVIVVFDGCKKSVVEDYKKLSFGFKPLTVVSEKNVGRSAARNKGIKIANGDYVLFLDDDRIVSPQFVQAHLKAHERANGPAVVLGARKEIYLSDEEIKALGDSFEGVIERCEKDGEKQNYPFSKKEKYFLRWINFFTGNVSVDRNLVQKVGCFDEWFVKWGGEDNDLGIRLYLEKVRYFYEDDAINYHLMHESNFLNQGKQALDNFKYMIKKYRSHFLVKLGLYDIYFETKHFGLKVAQEQIKRFEQAKAQNKQIKIVNK